jgi:hypothetical protein
MNLDYGFPFYPVYWTQGRSRLKKFLRIPATIGRDILIKGEVEFINGN